MAEKEEKSPKTTTTMDTLEKHFKKKMNKDGVILTAGQLLSFSKEKKLGLSKQKIYAFLQQQSAVGQFLQARKTKEYQTMSVIRPGVYHIDFAEFKKEWAGSNKGCTGFLVAVENFTNKLFAIPCRGKGTVSFQARKQASFNCTMPPGEMCGSSGSPRPSRRWPVPPTVYSSAMVPTVAVSAWWMARARAFGKPDFRGQFTR